MERFLSSFSVWNISLAADQYGMFPWQPISMERFSGYRIFIVCFQSVYQWWLGNICI